MEVPDEIMQNWFLDLQKKDIDKFRRAEIISLYIREKRISQREFGRRFNIPKSNVEDWLLWNKINQKRFNELVELGYEPTDIYRELRNHKEQSAEEIFSVETKLDLILYKFTRTIENIMDKYPPKSNKTPLMIQEAKNMITALEKHYGLK